MNRLKKDFHLENESSSPLFCFLSVNRLRHVILYCSFFLWFSALGQQPSTVTGNLFVHPTGSISFLGDLTINQGSNFTVQGDIDLSGQILGSERIDLSSSANLTLRNNAAFLLQHESNEEINQLSIYNSGALSVPSGNTLLLNGNFLNNSNNVGVYLLADGNGYSQLKVNGSSQGSGKVSLEQYISNNGWHNLSMPVAGMISEFGAINTAIHPNTRNIYFWDEANSQWVSPAGATDGSTTANIPGLGYLVYVGTNGVIGSAGVIDVEGQLITAANTSLTNAGSSGNPDYDQWNLVANPFTCGLDFSMLNRNQLFNSFSIWDPGANSYRDYSGLAGDFTNPTVAPLQSFWVRTSGANPSLTNMEMAQSGTLNLGSSFFKAQSLVDDRFFVRVDEVTQPQKYDDILVGMVSGATDGLDLNWDAASKRNAGDVPTLMMVIQGEEISHNAIDYGPGRTYSKFLPVHFESNKDQVAYRFSLADSLLLNNYSIELEDLKNQVLYNLRAGDYLFTNDTAYPSHRFILHINPGSIGVNENESANIKVGQSLEHQEVVIAFESLEGKNAHVYISNVLGQIIYKNEHLSEGKLNIPIHRKGLYMVNVRVGTKTVVQRVWF